MKPSIRPYLFLLLSMAAVPAARADMVGTFSPNPITQATSVGFNDSSVTVGTLGSGTNFVDEWNFTLDGSFQVSTVAASIAFTDVNGHDVLQGVTNLQLDLVSDAAPTSPIVAWQQVSTPASGLIETIDLVPPTALGAGGYMLEVRGLVAPPGSYSGTMEVMSAPPVVPLPAPNLLLGAGVVALAFIGRRTRLGRA